MQVINLIRNCQFRFRKVCPQKWDQLAPTPTEGVKFCGTCHQDVFFCEADAEALEHAREPGAASLSRCPTYPGFRTAT